jgi:uncharacterized protein GlcG (DUF336 family)
MDICVVDAGANLVAFAMDGAWMGSDISFKKAKTSMVTHGHCHFNAVGKTQMPVANIEHSNGGLITFPGGVIKKQCW